MAVFVINISMKKLIEAKEKDKVILKAWVNTATLTGNTHNINIKQTTEISASPNKNYVAPFYSNKTLSNSNQHPYRWFTL